MGTALVSPVDVRMVVVAPVYALDTNSTMLGGAPMWGRVVWMTECGMLPNALRRSSQARLSFLVCRRVSATTDDSK